MLKRPARASTRNDAMASHVGAHVEIRQNSRKFTGHF
jgi:hypothetical protein